MTDTIDEECQGEGFRVLETCASWKERNVPTGIDRDEVQRLVREESAQLVEVLPRRSFEALHIPGAVSISLKRLDRETTSGLDGTRPVIVYCYDYT